MKKYLAVIVFMALGILSFSQTSKSDSTKIKHEVSIIVEDIFQKNNFPYYSDYNNRYDYIYYNQFYGNNGGAKVGVGYRLHFGKYAIRSKVIFSSSENSQVTPDRGESIYSSVNLSASLGIERHIDIKKAQLFYGLDFGIMSNEHKYEYKDFTNSNSSYKSNTKSTSYFFAPLLGFKYHFHPAISVSTELKFNIEKYYTQYNFDYEMNINDDEQKSVGLRTKLGPVGFLSLNFHF